MINDCYLSPSLVVLRGFTLFLLIANYNIWLMVTGCHFLNFPRNIGNVIIPIDEVHHFSEGWPWPTNQIFLWPVHGKSMNQPTGMTLKVFNAARWTAVLSNVMKCVAFRLLYSMDWFRGKFTGQPHISWENLWFPLNFPLNQSIDVCFLSCHSSPKWIGSGKSFSFLLSMDNQPTIKRQQFLWTTKDWPCFEWFSHSLISHHLISVEYLNVHLWCSTLLFWWAFSLSPDILQGFFPKNL